MNTLGELNTKMDTVGDRLDHVGNRLSFLETNFSESLKRVEDRLEKVEDRLEKVEDNLKTVEDRLEKVEVKFENISTTVTSLSDRLSGVDDNLKTLLTKFSNNEQSFERAGLTYEMVLRNEIAKSRGVDFVRPFNVQNLEGLARISLPKDTSFDDNCSSGPSLSWSIQESRLDALVARAIPLLTQLETLSQAETKSRKIFDLRKQLQQFNSLPEDRKKAFLITSPLGFSAISSLAFED